MKKTMIVSGLITGLALAALPVYAQAPAPATQKVFVNVNFGGQFSSDRTIETALTQTVYEETATLTSSTPVSGGALFDVSAGYRVWGDFFAALAITTFGDTSTADFTATVPNPIFFNRPATSTGTIEDLKRKEIGFHPQLVWAHPLTDKVDLAVSVGPSFVKLSQDVIEGLTVPVDTQTAIASVTKEKATAKGIHFGADVTYTITPRYGAGVFFRYVNASVDLPTSQNVKTGGSQLGVGVRVRLY
jgi:hypothetical protein